MSTTERVAELLTGLAALRARLEASEVVFTRTIDAGHLAESAAALREQQQLLQERQVLLDELINLTASVTDQDSGGVG